VPCGNTNAYSYTNSNAYIDSNADIDGNADSYTGGEGYTVPEVPADSGTTSVVRSANCNG
jgi:hypothetical protein